MTTYHDACLDPALFGDWFFGETWATWRVLDKAIFGEPLTDAEMEVFRELTGRQEAPSAPVAEAWLIMGRRSGKDVKAASIVAYLATIGNLLFGFSDRLVPGERGVVQLLARDRDQSRICLGYLRAFFRKPLLAKLVDGDATKNGFDLKNGLSIEVTTNDLGGARGRTVIAAVFDEVAFWRNENSTNPDTEVYTAVKGSMATIPEAMLLGISSPYARRGLLWKRYRKHFGKPSSRVLVAQAPTWRMNPLVPRDGQLISEAYEDDPIAAEAEYGAQFRSDVEALLTREAIEALVPNGIFEREPVSGVSYVAFVDPSGGSADSMTLAIGHRETDGRGVLDVVRERKPPFSPEDVVEDFCALLKSYRISRVKGDRYGGEWCREPFRKRGIAYDVSEKAKSDLYRDMVPDINSGRVDLLDHPRLVSQLSSLERRTARGGRDTIDHPPGGHDDIANAVAGCLVALQLGPRQGAPFYIYTWNGTPVSDNAIALAHEQWKAREDLKRSMGL